VLGQKKKVFFNNPNRLYDINSAFGDLLQYILHRVFLWEIFRGQVLAAPTFRYQEPQPALLNPAVFLNIAGDTPTCFLKYRLK